MVLTSQVIKHLDKETKLYLLKISFPPNSDMEPIHVYGVKLVSKTSKLTMRSVQFFSQEVPGYSSHVDVSSVPIFKIIGVF